MKKTEKDSLIERGVELIQQGETLSFIEKEMSKKGYSKFDIYNIFSSIKDYFYKKYNKEINELIQKDKLQENIDKYSFLGNSILNYIKQEVYLDLKREKKKKIIKLIKEANKTEDIIKKEACDYYGETEIKKYIKDYKRSHNILSPLRKKINLVIGIILLVTGLIFFVSNPYRDTGNIIYFIVLGAAFIISSQNHRF